MLWNKGGELRKKTGCYKIPTDACDVCDKVNVTVVAVRDTADNASSPVIINPLTPNDPYRGRTALLTSKFVFYTYIQQM